MSVYWKSASPAPPNAKFYLFPFLTQKKSAHPPFQRKIKLPAPAKIRPSRMQMFPSRSEWKENVENVLAQIEKGRLDKVVLARRVDLFFSHEVNPFALTHSLKEKAQNATLFCFEMKHSAFLGASPETLFSTHNHTLSTIAMAGTKKLGEPFSKKEKEECLFVKKYLKQILAPYSPQFSPLKIYQNSYLQHLVWECKAALQKKISPFSLMHRLHPTPAVLGWPKKEALLCIEALEPFSREFYAGVVGWENGESSDWKVAIRSCFIKKNCISFYTGAGIVAGSDPDLEWEELNLKMKTFEDLYETSLCFN